MSKKVFICNKHYSNVCFTYRIKRNWSRIYTTNSICMYTQYARKYLFFHFYLRRICYQYKCSLSNFMNTFFFKKVAATPCSTTNKIHLRHKRKKRFLAKSFLVASLNYSITLRPLYKYRYQGSLYSNIPLTILSKAKNGGYHQFIQPSTKRTDIIWIQTNRSLWFSL